jgi:Amidohydrolase family
VTNKRMTVVRNGRLLDIAAHRAPPVDILIDGDCIAEIGPPGLAAPDDAAFVDASDRLIHPGLINAHTHGHGNLSKGMGDRWTLELLLTAAPWISGNRTVEDKYLSTYIGALEMLMKGCTACYDLTVEFPQPTPEGLAACAQAYADAGMRAVVAPMVASLTLYEAIPGLIDVLPPPLQQEVTRLRLAPSEASLASSARRSRIGASTASRSVPRWRQPSRIIAATLSCGPAHGWRGNSALACTATSRNRKRRSSSASRPTARPRRRISRTWGCWAPTSSPPMASGSTMTTSGGSPITAHPWRTTPAATCCSATASRQSRPCWSVASTSASAPMEPPVRQSEHVRVDARRLVRLESAGARH